MTIRITLNCRFRPKSGTSKRGQAYSIREQTGFAATRRRSAQGRYFPWPRSSGLLALSLRGR